MYRYNVVKNQLITPSIRLLTLRCTDCAQPMLYWPGQYAAIGLKDKKRPTVMRCFSITSSPNDQQVLQFSMRVKGRFTSAIGRLKESDSVLIRGPFGGFVFDPGVHQDSVFFAGGIGIAPFISMVRYASSLKLSNRLHLIYSCRDYKDVAFFDELKKLESRNPNLKVTYVIGSIDKNLPPADGSVINGRLDQSTLELLGLNLQEQIFFVCGPPGYMKSVIDLLNKNGVPKRRVLSEAFSQSSSRQTGKLISWPFNMYALTGVALMVVGFSIVASDLYKTLPKLQQKANLTSSSSNNVLPGSYGSITDSVNSSPPQINTNTSQSPKIVNSSGGTSSGVNNSSPSTTPASRPVTTTPTTPVRSTVS